MTIGGQMVQDVDYAYTLQGWLKGVNSIQLSPDHDMGADGKVTAANRYVARDAFGFSLNYFAGDYQLINGLIRTTIVAEFATPMIFVRIQGACRPSKDAQIVTVMVYRIVRIDAQR